MHDAGAVRRVERARHVQHDPPDAIGREAPVVAHLGGEVVPVDEAHRDEERPVLLARLVDGDDVGVLEGGRHARLALEALAELRVGRELGHDDLERHTAAQATVDREVDHAHAAAPDLALDVVGAEGPVLVGGHGTRYPARAQAVSTARATVSVCPASERHQRAASARTRAAWHRPSCSLR